MDYPGLTKSPGDIDFPVGQVTFRTCLPSFPPPKSI